MKLIKSRPDSYPARHLPYRRFPHSRHFRNRHSSNLEVKFLICWQGSKYVDLCTMIGRYICRAGVLLRWDHASPSGKPLRAGGHSSHGPPSHPCWSFIGTGWQVKHAFQPHIGFAFSGKYTVLFLHRLYVAQIGSSPAPSENSIPRMKTDMRRRIRRAVHAVQKLERELQKLYAALEINVEGML